MSAQKDGIGVGDHIGITLRDKDGKIKDIRPDVNKLVPSYAFGIQFCAKCGSHHLVQIPLFFCEDCQNRYIIRLQEGKPIIIDIGKEKK